ncbi:MAG: peptide chain release factor N(5)-glutamine methyltransferase [Calditrichaeota bacterium]|nr:peptide chain release factor N(5)-glutamine methyltransferase [Calditrichota bacterium]
MNGNRYQALKKWRVIDLIQWTTQFFEKKSIPDARLNAERLLSRVLGLNRVQLYLQFENILTQDQLDSFRESVKRRLNNEPLQYILGETEFMSLPFKLSPSVLIPRPDTEILVEQVLENTPQNMEITILDIGTGSGNIAVSLAHYLPQSRIVAVDISQEAIDVARENAELNRVNDRIRFIREDVFDGSFIMKLGNRFDRVVSNPPYISETEFYTLPEEVRNFEPHIALRDGADGLTFHRRISQVAAEMLTPGGKVFLEVGQGQWEKVLEILEQDGFQNVYVTKDLAGIDRVLVGEKKFD